MSTEISTRRYDCRACGAILVVMPRGVARGYRYAVAAIALALALWAAARTPSAAVRGLVSAAKTVGQSATRWPSLLRWTRSAAAIFGTAPHATGTLRERAHRVAVFVASRAPMSQGPVVLDAFFGAAFCESG